MKQWMARAAWMMPVLMALGCREASTSSAADQQASADQPQASSLFDPATAGTIRGTIVWSGDLPKVPPFEIRTLVTAANPPRPRLIRENPHAPVIDGGTRGIAGAVVFLRKVDPRKARPWDHPPVTVEHADRRLAVVQGDARSLVGFVRQGEAIGMVSRETIFNSLHAGGAAFFTLTFPEPDQPLTRVLKNQGIVELTSAAGYYWMRSYLFVDNHPYFARTDARGAFELRQVPPGQYQIVCWMPNWNKKSEDHDPESELVTRVHFQAPLVLERQVVLDPAGEAKVDFSIQLGKFERK